MSSRCRSSGWRTCCAPARAGPTILQDANLHSHFLDPDLIDGDTGKVHLRDAERLFVNFTDSWASRPEAVLPTRNMVLASDYVRSFTDVACMEAANEAARRAVNGLPVAQRLVFFPAYICVDNTWSLAAGREVYGFPKSYGPVAIPAAGMPPSTFKASMLVMKTFGPQNEGVFAPLLQVDCIAQEGLCETLWHDLEAVVGAIADMWLGNGPGTDKLGGWSIVSSKRSTSTA